MPAPSSPRLSAAPAALVFDIFGTVADWHGTIARAAPVIAGAGLDGSAFARAWRAEYQPAMARIRDGNRGYVKLDVLHRENLDRILPKFGLGHLGEDKRIALNALWHRLDGWPDSAPGLARLKTKFIIAPMSNGNISLMVDMARHNGFSWDAILGADIARDYKPKPEVYRAGCDALGLDPERCMMVAAHSDDLAAAAACGFRTAHIARPSERGPDGGEAGPSVPVDVAARDLVDLADRLGA